jgi:hypothetical protein
MDYLKIFGAANDQAFQSRCRVATWKAAQDIAAEDPATPCHESRKDWASRVLADKTNITDRQLAMQVLRNPQIAADAGAAPDGDIQYQVNSVLDAIIAIG